MTNAPKNGIDLETNIAHSIPHIANVHNHQSSSISSSCRSSKCCCSSYDCSYCSPHGSINDDSHHTGVDDFEDEAQQDDTTFADDQKTLVPLDYKAELQSDIYLRKKSGLQKVDDKQNEAVPCDSNNLVGATAKVHHHHHHRHHLQTTAGANAMVLQLQPYSGEGKATQSKVADVATKHTQVQSVAAGRNSHNATGR